MLLLAAFSILFWALFAQRAMSLTLYTEYNVNRNTMLGIIPTTMFLALSPFYVIAGGLILSKLWSWLDKKNKNPSIPTKFAIGTILMGLGFIILPLAMLSNLSNGKINFIWIILSYFLQSAGELLISPVGLSMMTALSPKNMVGLMIGTWYFAMAVANALGGFISKLTVIPAHSQNPLETSSIYLQTFGLLGLSAIVAGISIIFYLSFTKNNISR